MIAIRPGLLIMAAYVAMCLSAWPLPPGRYFGVLAAFIVTLYAARRAGQPEGEG